MPVIKDTASVYYPGVSKKILDLTGAVTGTTVLTDDYGLFANIRAQLVVTGTAGTSPTLDVTLDESTDGGTTWNTIITFTRATAATSEVKNFTGLFGPKLRLAYTVGGTATPTFNFSVSLFAKP